MYDIEYILEKLTQAIYFLCTGEGDARARVDKAYHAFWLIKSDDFPVHLQNSREEIDRLLTKLPGREGYIIADNLSKMKNKTASRIAGLILGLYIGIREHVVESKKNT